MVTRESSCPGFSNTRKMRQEKQMCGNNTTIENIGDGHTRKQGNVHRPAKAAASATGCVSGDVVLRIGPYAMYMNSG
jgi:hypothetical protein